MTIKDYGSDVWNFFNKHSKTVVTDCIFCGPAPFVELFKKETMTVVRCKCSFVYNRTQPTPETLDLFYKQSAAMTKWAEIKQKPVEILRQREKFGEATKFIYNIGTKSVLDVGCGTGEFLKLLSELNPNMRLVGIDTNEASCFVARQTKAEIHVTDNLPDEIFDIISLWGVLEHHQEPGKLITQIKERLKPGKSILICVPNVESDLVCHIWQKAFTFCPQHLWYFSITTLERFLEKHGFSPYKTYTIESESIAVAKHRLGLDPYKPWPEEVERKDFVPLLRRLDIDTIRKHCGYKIVCFARLGGSISAPRCDNTC